MSKTYMFKPHELRMTMEAIYTARYELRKTWSESLIKDSLYHLALTFGLPQTKGLMPDIYKWIMNQRP